MFYDDLWILTKDAMIDCGPPTHEVVVPKGTIVKHYYHEASTPLLETLDGEERFYSADDECEPLYLHLARKLAEAEEYEASWDTEGEHRRCEVCAAETIGERGIPHLAGCCPFHILGQLVDYLGDFVTRCAYCGSPAHYYVGGTNVCGKPECFIGLVDMYESALAAHQDGPQGVIE